MGVEEAVLDAIFNNKGGKKKINRRNVNRAFVRPAYAYTSACLDPKYRNTLLKEKLNAKRDK